MILVTGATGSFGMATIDFLLNKGVAATNIAALVRDEAKTSTLKEKGIELRMGDYDNETSLINAFKGVDKLLFVSGSDIINRSKQHENVVRAAKEAGVQHIVYTSFLGKNETTSSPLWIVAQSHLQTENWLKETGINFTILKNTLYMDFVPAFLGENVVETGVIYLPAGNGRVGAVLRAEMAEATANILMSDHHAGKTYHFTNTDSFSYQDVAASLSEITGKTINYISPSADEYTKTLTEYGVPADYIGLFAGFAVAQANEELDMVGSDLEHLLGRKPTSVKTFLNQVYSS